VTSTEPSTEPILVPIAGEVPVGKDLTYEPHVVDLDAEVQKMTALEGASTDWNKVRGESLRILREETKDLRIAAWWVVAVANVGSWAAAAEALSLYGALADRFWAEMYPPVKRLRGRGALLGWVWDSLVKTLTPRTATLPDKEGVVALEAAVTTVDKEMNERLGDANPAIGQLRSLLREKIRLIPEAPAAPAPAAASDGAAGGGIAGPAAVTAQNLEEAEAAAAGYVEPLQKLAAVARASAPTSPWSYRLARVATWLTIERMPEVEAGKTFVRGPQDREALQALAQSASWDALREAAEDALSQNVFWLDIHRYSALALEHLGPTHAQARAAVERETFSLVERLPGLPNQLFSDGTPFASADTVDWLAQGLAARGSGEGAGRSKKDATRALLADCEAKIAAGQIDEALGEALTAAGRGQSARARFSGKLGVAVIAQRNGKARFALGILEGLLAEVNPVLEAWEPKLCGAFFEALLRSVQAAAPEDQDRQELLFRRLLAADPVAALRIEG
jgi:type VI secretion system protein VasJ